MKNEILLGCSNFIILCLPFEFMIALFFIIIRAKLNTLFQQIFELKRVKQFGIYS